MKPNSTPVIDRRHFLRGPGVSLALPVSPMTRITRFFLSSMVLCGLLLSGLLNGAEPTILPENLRKAFATAKTERVAIVALGDSNQQFGGHGWSYYMARALGETFGCYGSTLMFYHQDRGKDAPIPAEAPAALATKAYDYWYVPAGQTGYVGWRNGTVIIPADHPLNVRGSLRFHLTYGTFDDAGGSFQPVIRRDSPPWTVLKSMDSSVETQTGRPQLTDLVMDLPADSSRDYPLQFMPAALNKPIQGAFLLSAAHCENLDKASGIAYHTLYAGGGQSVCDMVVSLREKRHEHLASFFSLARTPLNGAKTCVVMINSGLNDRNENELSVGPNHGLESSSPEGYVDNLEGVTQTLLEGWIKAGGNRDSIFFVYIPSHALGDPEDTKLVSYRAAAGQLAQKNNRAAMIDLSSLVPYRVMEQSKFYDQGTSSSPHLDRKGYQAISEAVAEALAR